jgi:hypothetical protein
VVRSSGAQDWASASCQPEYHAGEKLGAKRRADEMSDYHDSQYMYEAQDQLEQMAQLAQNHFASLIDDKGFSFGPTERTAYNFTMFRYLQSPLCLEIEMDFRDNGVGMYALKLDDATVPKNTWVMYNSDRRIYFLTLLRNVLKVQDDRLMALYQHQFSEGPHGYRWAMQGLDQYRDLVMDYSDTVLVQPLDRLFPSKG